jgi:predicted nucleic acid-binding protein
VIRQELLTGIRSEAEFEELRSWLRFYDDLPADFETHELAAQYANQCLGAGVVTSAIDILICAIALKHQLPVFTLDDGFKKIQSVVPITFHVAK